MSDRESNTSESETEADKKNEFIRWLLQRIEERNDDKLTEKQYYTKLSDKIKFYANVNEMMEKDPIFQDLESKAQNYVDENSELTISTEAAMGHALKQHKSLLLEEINEFLNNDSNEERDDGDDSSDEDNADINDDQSGEGHRTKTMLTNPYHNYMRQ